MRGSAAWERLRVKADMVLFAGYTVWSISERVRGVREDALYKSTLLLPLSAHISSTDQILMKLIKSANTDILNDFLVFFNYMVSSKLMEKRRVKELNLKVHFSLL